MAMIVQIFTPSYFATNVIENCALLPPRLFGSNWVELDQIEQKSMLLFMTRIFRSLEISAGSLIDINVDTFLRVRHEKYCSRIQLYSII